MYAEPSNQGVKFAEAPTGRSFYWPIVHAEGKSPNPYTYVTYYDTSGRLHGQEPRRGFKGERTGRYHAGVDVGGYSGDTVVAIEDGVVVATQQFLSLIPGKDSLLVRSNSNGNVLNYGEMDPASIAHHASGQPIVAGQKLGVLGTVSGMESRFHMLHFETYKPGTTHTWSWSKSAGGPPAALLNPTKYLLEAYTRGARL